MKLGWIIVQVVWKRRKAMYWLWYNTRPWIVCMHGPTVDEQSLIWSRIAGGALWLADRMISNIGSQKSDTSSFLVPNGKDHKSDLANHACFIRLDPFIHPSIHSSILPLIHRFVCFESVASFIWNLYMFTTHGATQDHSAWHFYQHTLTN